MAILNRHPADCTKTEHRAGSERRTAYLTEGSDSNSVGNSRLVLDQTSKEYTRRDDEDWLLV
jgi:hypothetical protein